jgi:hypothetical protein
LNHEGKRPPERKKDVNVNPDKSETYSDSTMQKRYNYLLVDIPINVKVTIFVDDSSYGEQKKISLSYGKHKIRIVSDKGIVEREITIPDKSFLPISAYDFQKR